MAVVASLLAGASLVGAQSAGAYPNPTGTGSGSCSPGNQLVANGSTASITCTFTFVDPSNNPVPPTAVTVTATPGNVVSNSSPTSNGVVTAGVAYTCTASSSNPIEVLATSHPAGSPDVTAGAAANVTCADPITIALILGIPGINLILGL